ncbi:SET domain-containing protein SmydA-8-like [Anthonomus grandis grandis]|uniref:SET domain-containing protein SmydA-8-like n=1 Tax=Anthonomus grandis grandis TaxID=2921223 RepID=UPI002165F605|nr:SET domain-containing protein SmydA-8-like [Anthonomus grandis grandis]
MDLFKVEKNAEVGRYAVAAKNLKAGEVIFSELPFTYGPKSDSPCLCLGCHAPVDCTYLCTKCKWPVCGPDCESVKIHKENECEIFSKANAQFQPVEDPADTCLQYECITPLRVLLEKERNPKRWEEEVAVMESHDSERKTNPIWEFNQQNVVGYIRGPCKLTEFPEELIHKVCGILEVNAFEARTPSCYTIRCLFPKLAILSHNCISNIHHAVDCVGNGDFNDCRVTVRAAIDIPEKGELYSSYTYSLWPTLVRREFLRESKYFDCKCERCGDKTELGTHLSTLKCQRCDNGVIVSSNPLDDTCEWKCTHCDYKTHGRAVRKVFAAIQNEIDQVEYVGGSEGIQQRETIFRKYKSVLHPKNAYMTILRSALTQLYGKAEGYTLEDLPDIILERKIELCQQLLEVLDVIEPGMSRIRGITLYELHGPLMIHARHQYQYGALDRDDFKGKLQQSVETLRKAVEILKHEPVSQPEGQLGQMAQAAYEQLIENFDLLVETA